MMDEKAVGLVLRFAVLAKHGANALSLLARVYKHEALAPSCVFKDVTDPWVCIDRRCVGGVEQLLFGDRWNLNIAFCNICSCACLCVNVRFNCTCMSIR